MDFVRRIQVVLFSSRGNDRCYEGVLRVFCGAVIVVYGSVEINGF